MTSQIDIFSVSKNDIDRGKFDAVEQRSQDLLDIFTGVIDKTLCLTPDLSRTLAATSGQADLPDCFWCIFEPENLGDLYRYFVSIGATCVVTQTAGCSESQLRDQALVSAVEKGCIQACEQAYSPGAPFVLGMMGATGDWQHIDDAKNPICDFDELNPYDEEGRCPLNEAMVRRVKMCAMEQASALRQGDAQGFVLDAKSVFEAVTMVEGIRLASHRPVIVNLYPKDQELSDLRQALGNDSTISEVADLEAIEACRLGTAIKWLLDSGATTIGFQFSDMTCALANLDIMRMVQKAFHIKMMLSVENLQCTQDDYAQNAATKIKNSGISLIRALDSTDSCGIARLYAFI